MNLDFVTVTHMHSHISLFCTVVGGSGLLFGVAKSKRKQRGYGMLSKRPGHLVDAKSLRCLTLYARCVLVDVFWMVLSFSCSTGTLISG